MFLEGIKQHEYDKKNNKDKTLLAVLTIAAIGMLVSSIAIAKPALASSN
jgi:hypothetical protein